MAVRKEEPSYQIRASEPYVRLQLHSLLRIYFESMNIAQRDVASIVFPIKAVIGVVYKPIREHKHNIGDIMLIEEN